jgi:arsenate reductase (thioredoxin)
VSRLAGPADDGALGRARSRSGRGTEAERHFAFAEAWRMLSARISIFVNLPVDAIDRMTLKARLDEIGRGADLTA